MPNGKKLGKFELQRLAKDARWTRKWARIESRYRRPIKESEVEKIKEPVLQEPIETPFKTPLTGFIGEPAPQPSAGIPGEPAPPEEPIEEPESVLTGLLENPFFETPSEFIFKLPDGNEVGKAKDLQEFCEFVRRGPLDSILHHANEDHFSPWLEYKGYKKLARKIKNIKGTSKKTRKRLLRLISRNL